MADSRYRHDPEGERLPIKVDSTSNGEFIPQPLQAYEVAALERAQREASENARRLNLGRRSYMISPCAAATALLALNEAARARGRTGGFFALDPCAGTDEAAAAAVLEGDEFIFDVQNHAVNPNGPWRDAPGAEAMKAQLRRLSPHSASDGEYDYMGFMDGDHCLKDVFLDSDTHTAAMSVHATDHHDEPLRIEDAAAIRALVDRLGQGRRLLLHGKALPNFPGDLDQRDPEQAAHAWGMPLKHVGEENVLWGTDCVWAGLPPDQIQAFRAFQISEEFQERYGYPALSPALKARGFGPSAARVYGIDVPDLRRTLQDDDMTRQREAYRPQADPSYVTHGPKTEAELQALLRSRGAAP